MRSLGKPGALGSLGVPANPTGLGKVGIVSELGSLRKLGALGVLGNPAGLGKVGIVSRIPPR